MHSSRGSGSKGPGSPLVDSEQVPRHRVDLGAGVLGRLAWQPCLDQTEDHAETSFFLFVYLAVLGLRCCPWAFSCCGEWGLLSSCWVRVSHCGGFSCCGARVLWNVGSVVIAHGLSCPAVCRIFPGQRSNPGPLHWQMHWTTREAQKQRLFSGMPVRTDRLTQEHPFPASPGCLLTP